MTGVDVRHAKCFNTIRVAQQNVLIIIIIIIIIQNL